MKKILILDEKLAKLQDLSELIAGLGFEIIEDISSASPRDAIAAARPEIIIINLSQGDSRAIELLTSIRASNPDLRIMALVQSADIDVHHELSLAGADIALEYPCSHGIILQNLEIIAGKRHSSI